MEMPSYPALRLQIIRRHRTASNLARVTGHVLNVDSGYGAAGLAYDPAEIAVKA